MEEKRVLCGFYIAVLDAVGTVRAPARAVISLIDAEEAKWTAC